MHDRNCFSVIHDYFYAFPPHDTESNVFEHFASAIQNCNLFDVNYDVKTSLSFKNMVSEHIVKLDKHNRLLYTDPLLILTDRPEISIIYPSYLNLNSSELYISDDNTCSQFSSSAIISVDNTHTVSVGLLDSKNQPVTFVFLCHSSFNLLPLAFLDTFVPFRRALSADLTLPSFSSFLSCGPMPNGPGFEISYGSSSSMLTLTYSDIFRFLSILKLTAYTTSISVVLSKDPSNSTPFSNGSLLSCVNSFNADDGLLNGDDPCATISEGIYSLTYTLNENSVDVDTCVRNIVVKNPTNELCADNTQQCPLDSTCVDLINGDGTSCECDATTISMFFDPILLSCVPVITNIPEDDICATLNPCALPYVCVSGKGRLPIFSEDSYVCECPFALDSAGSCISSTSDYDDALTVLSESANLIISISLTSEQILAIANHLRNISFYLSSASLERALIICDAIYNALETISLQIDPSSVASTLDSALSAIIDVLAIQTIPALLKWNINHTTLYPLPFGTRINFPPISAKSRLVLVAALLSPLPSLLSFVSRVPPAARASSLLFESTWKLAESLQSLTTLEVWTDEITTPGWRNEDEENSYFSGLSIPSSFCLMFKTNLDISVDLSKKSLSQTSQILSDSIMTSNLMYGLRLMAMPTTSTSYGDSGVKFGSTGLQATVSPLSFGDQSIRTVLIGETRFDFNMVSIYMDGIGVHVPDAAALTACSSYNEGQNKAYAVIQRTLASTLSSATSSFSSSLVQYPSTSLGATIGVSIFCVPINGNDGIFKVPKVDSLPNDYPIVLHIPSRLLPTGVSKPEAVCAFLNSEKGEISADGCERDSSLETPGYIRCVCNHLTDFFLLDQPLSKKYSSNDLPGTLLFRLKRLNEINVDLNRPFWALVGLFSLFLIFKSLFFIFFIKKTGEGRTDTAIEFAFLNDRSILNRLFSEAPHKVRDDGGAFVKELSFYRASQSLKKFGLKQNFIDELELLHLNKRGQLLSDNPYFRQNNYQLNSSQNNWLVNQSRNTSISRGTTFASSPAGSDQLIVNELKNIMVKINKNVKLWPSRVNYWSATLVSKQSSIVLIFFNFAHKLLFCARPAIYELVSLSRNLDFPSIFSSRFSSGSEFKLPIKNEKKMVASMNFSTLYYPFDVQNKNSEKKIINTSMKSNKFCLSFENGQSLLSQFLKESRHHSALRTRAAVESLSIVWRSKRNKLLNHHRSPNCTCPLPSQSINITSIENRRNCIIPASLPGAIPSRKPSLENVLSSKHSVTDDPSIRQQKSFTSSPVSSCSVHNDKWSRVYRRQLARFYLDETNKFNPRSFETNPSTVDTDEEESNFKWAPAVFFASEDLQGGNKKNTNVNYNDKNKRDTFLELSSPKSADVEDELVDATILQLIPLTWSSLRVFCASFSKNFPLFSPPSSFCMPSSLACVLHTTRLLTSISMLVILHAIIDDQPETDKDLLQFHKDSPYFNKPPLRKPFLSFPSSSGDSFGPYTWSETGFTTFSVLLVVISMLISWIIPSILSSIARTRTPLLTKFIALRNSLVTRVRMSKGCVSCSIVSNEWKLKWIQNEKQKQTICLVIGIVYGLGMILMGLIFCAAIGGSFSKPERYRGTLELFSSVMLWIITEFVLWPAFKSIVVTSYIKAILPFTSKLDWVLIFFPHMVTDLWNPTFDSRDVKPSRSIPRFQFESHDVYNGLISLRDITDLTHILPYRMQEIPGRNMNNDGGSIPQFEVHDGSLIAMKENKKHEFDKLWLDAAQLQTNKAGRYQELEFNTPTKELASNRTDTSPSIYGKSPLRDPPLETEKFTTEEDVPEEIPINTIHKS